MSWFGDMERERDKQAAAHQAEAMQESVRVSRVHMLQAWARVYPWVKGVYPMDGAGLLAAITELVERLIAAERVDAAKLEALREAVAACNVRGSFETAASALNRMHDVLKAAEELVR